MSLRQHRPRSIYALVMLSCVAMIVIAIPSVFRIALPSAAADPTVLIDPSSELVHGQTINVTITSDRAWSGGRFFGVSICGNADSSGRPLRVRDVNDCVGAEVGVPTGSNGLNSVSDSGQGISGATGGGGITAGRTYTTTVGAKRLLLVGITQPVWRRLSASFLIALFRWRFQLRRAKFQLRVVVGQRTFPFRFM